MQGAQEELDVRNLRRPFPKEAREAWEGARRLRATIPETAPTFGYHRGQWCATEPQYFAPKAQGRSRPNSKNARRIREGVAETSYDRRVSEFARSLGPPPKATPRNGRSVSGWEPSLQAGNGRRNGRCATAGARIQIGAIAARIQIGAIALPPVQPICRVPRAW